MNVTLISTYELGHQPFGLASPAAWLRDAGMDVQCVDVAIRPFSPTDIQNARLIAFYLPMHTAT
ncbi:MAG: radical SAM protein, partial [Chloroflexi bacterium]